LVGFSAVKGELDALGAKVIAASVDPIDKAREVAGEVSFPIGYGVTRDIANTLGAWWEDRRSIIQPSEFIVGTDNKIIVSSYSDGPLGRIEGGDVVKLIRFYESRKGQ
jgi:alkyl hydroperoxide reductase subunit AhpC